MRRRVRSLLVLGDRLLADQSGRVQSPAVYALILALTFAGVALVLVTIAE